MVDAIATIQDSTTVVVQYGADLVRSLTAEGLADIAAAINAGETTLNGIVTAGSATLDGIVTSGTTALNTATSNGQAAIAADRASALAAIAADRASALAAIDTAETDALAVITPLVETAQGHAATASEGAATVTEALAELSAIEELFLQPIALEVYDPDGLQSGGFYADYSTAAALRVSRFVGLISEGTGTVNVSLVADGVVLYGPVALSTSETVTTGLSLLIPAAADVSFFFEDMTGAPLAAFVKAEGRPE